MGFQQKSDALHHIFVENQFCLICSQFFRFFEFVYVFFLIVFIFIINKYIEIEKNGFSTEIRCTASDFRWKSTFSCLFTNWDFLYLKWCVFNRIFNGNPMHCIGFPFKIIEFQQKSDAVHRIFVESPIFFLFFFTEH